MAEPPLQLEGYYFRQASFEAIRKPQSDAVDLELVLSVTSVKRKESQNRFQTVLKVKFGPPAAAPIPFGYKGEVVVVGRFAVDPSLSEDAQAVVAKVEGATLLMGAAREIVALLTGRGQWARVLLPAVNFDFLRVQK